MWENSFHINNNVRFVERGRYDEILFAYMDWLTRIPEVVSIYQMGSISYPGISDIDLVVVLSEAPSKPVNFREGHGQAFGAEGLYVFSHAPYITDRETFKNLPMMFFADNLRHRWGEEYSFCQFPGESAEFYRFLIALEAAIAQSFAFMRAIQNSTISSLRSHLCHLNAVKHNFATLSEWRSQEEKLPWTNFTRKIDELRFHWFELPEDEGVARMLDLNIKAMDLMKDILHELLLVGRSKGYFSTLSHDVYFSLLDINILLHFSKEGVIDSHTQKNPARPLLKLPGLGPMLKNHRRLREAFSNVSVLQLPAEFFSLVGQADANDNRVGRILDQRVWKESPEKDAVSELPMRDWLVYKQSRLSKHLDFLAADTIQGYLPLTPAVWLNTSDTFPNRIKTRWNKTWATPRHRAEGKKNKRDRVIFLGPLPPPYMGPTLATGILLESRLAENFELIHLDTSDHRSLERLGVIDITNIYLALKSYVELLWLIIWFQPKMVYIPVSQTTLGYLKDSVYILLSKMFGRKVICHLRGGNFRNWYDSTRVFTRIYVRFTHALVDGQIVLGESLRGLFRGLVPDSHIYVVPNGRNFNYEVQNRKDDGVLRVLFIANLKLTKGVYDVIQAVPRVINKVENVEFYFVGAWVEPDVKKKIDRFMSDNPGLPVKFRGIVIGDEKYNLIASSDIFVFPSYYPAEGHPWVIVEAMAAGMPIISTDQGAICESVLHGKNGFIVEKQQPGAIAVAILKLVNDENLRKRFSSTSRQLYEQKFTEQKSVTQMMTAFNSVLYGRR